MLLSNFIGRNNKLRRQRREGARKSARRPRPIAAIGRAAASAIEALECRRLLAAPEVTLVGDATVNEGAELNLNLSVIPDDLLFATINWGEGIDANGDGMADDIISYTAAEVAEGVTHVYPDGHNTYTITLDLVIDNPVTEGEDDFFHEGVDTHALTVDNVAPDHRAVGRCVGGRRLDLPAHAGRRRRSGRRHGD